MHNFKQKLNFIELSEFARWPFKMRTPPGALAWVGSCCLAAFCIGLLVWLHTIDFYHKHFFDHGLLVTLYQLARLFFMPLLVWWICVVGAAVGVLICGRAGLADTPREERYPLTF